MTIAGAAILAIGGISSALEFSLALLFKNDIAIDDSTLQLFVYADSMIFVVAQLVIALFMVSAGLAVIRTGLIWRWSGYFALLAGVLLVIGSAWPIDGDPDGALAAPGFIGFGLWGVWTLITCVGLIRRRESPPNMA